MIHTDVAGPGQDLVLTWGHCHYVLTPASTTWAQEGVGAYQLADVVHPSHLGDQGVTGSLVGQVLSVQSRRIDRQRRNLRTLGLMHRTVGGTNFKNSQ